MDGVGEQPWMKALFGRAARVQVGLWVESQSSAFSQHDIAGELDVARTSVVQELGKLEELGLIRTVDAEGTRRKYYLRVDHPLWQVFAATRNAIGEMAPPAAREPATDR